MLRKARRFTLIPIVAVLLAAISMLGVLQAQAAAASVTRLKLSQDKYTNSSSQHQTEVEPDTYSYGSTIVSTFQSGRFPDSNGGSSNIGWATSTNNGSTWKHGFLSGITVYAGGSFARTTDPSVAYDPKHKVWLISSMGLIVPGGGSEILVSRSTNGGLTWSNPVGVAFLASNVLLDKDWIVCDTTSSSPFYGNCYDEFDDTNLGDLILMNTSTDGGQTWGNTLKETADQATGLGGQPLVEPSGTVVVPIDNEPENEVLAFTSTNGGASWSSTTVVQTIVHHKEAGGLRSDPLISAEIDGAGNIYVAWQDCRFVANCAANQIVYTHFSFSAGKFIKSPVRLAPINATASTTLADYFLPGIGVDRSTSGGTAHLVIAYYYYTNTNCTVSTCKLNVGYIASTNAGSTWSANLKLAGSMSLDWLPQSDLGLMVGDYISTSFSSAGRAYPVFMVASLPNGGVACSSAGAVCHENAYTVSGGLAALAGSYPSTTPPVLSTAGSVVSSKPTTAH